MGLRMNSSLEEGGGDPMVVSPKLRVLLVQVVALILLLL